MNDNYFDISLSRGSFTLSLAHDFSLGSCLGIYGESGSGKSSLLHCLAGLEKNCKGNFCFDGEMYLSDDVNLVSAEQRAISLCFQESKLFPHMNVDKNLQFAEKRAYRDSQQENYPTKRELIELLKLESLLGKASYELSGGEKKRLALAQVLLTRPRLLLLDEPLSFLDQDSQQSVMALLEKLLNSQQITVFYISHNMHEISRLCEQLIILEAGKIVFSGKSQEALTHETSPLIQQANPFVSVSASFLKYDEEYGISEFKSEHGQCFYVLSQHVLGDNIQLKIEANNVSLSLMPNDLNQSTLGLNGTDQSLSVLNQLSGQVENILTENKQSLLLLVDCGGDKILSKISRLSYERMQLTVGSHVRVLVKAASINEF